MPFKSILKIAQSDSPDLAQIISICKDNNPPEVAKQIKRIKKELRNETNGRKRAMALSKLKTLSWKDIDHDFGEAVADISYQLGVMRVRMEDSRALTGTVIQWAKEFQQYYFGFDWGIDDLMPDGSKPKYGDDYIEAIASFTTTKYEENREDFLPI